MSNEELELDRQMEMQRDAQDAYESSMRDEFNQAFNDFELAKLFVEHNDPELSFEEFCECEFEHYMEDRD